MLKRKIIELIFEEKIRMMIICVSEIIEICCFINFKKIIRQIIYKYFIKNYQNISFLKLVFIKSRFLTI